jgi:uncharacterized protein DUF6998
MTESSNSSLTKYTDLKSLSVIELLQLHSAILDDLKCRKIVRTRNNPVGDYTEWLVAKGLGLELAENSSAGFDATDSEGVKIQIKGRRISSENKSRQLGAIRKLDAKDFDHLAAVIFDNNYQIIDAILIPHKVIYDYANYSEHQNAHVLHLKGSILNDPRVEDIKKKISI